MDFEVPSLGLTLLAEGAPWSWLAWADGHGVWELINVIFLAIGAGLAIKILYFPRKRIPHLNFYLSVERTKEEKFPLKLSLQIRNNTGNTLIIANPYVILTELRAAPDAHGHTPTGELELKFKNAHRPELTETDCYLRHRETETSWVPLDPTQSESEIDAKQLKRLRIGRIKCRCICVADRPYVVDLDTPIYFS